MINIYEQFNITSNVAVTVISVAIMLFSGFLLTRLTKLLRLPNVTAYILAGILIGPYVLNLVPDSVVSGMNFLSDIALAFIAFTTGEFFKFNVLKKNGVKVIIITLFESLLSSILVFVAMFVVLKLNLAISVVLASLAAATAPASTLMTIRQTGAKGDFVDTLLLVIAVDNILCLLGYSIVLSIIDATSLGDSMNLINVLKPVCLNLFVLGLGGAFGALLKLLMPTKRSNDNRLIISISILFLFCGICALIGVSPLLGCMSMGAIYINTAKDDKLFKQLNYFSPPILLLFFVKSGVSFKLGSLGGSNASVGAVSIIIVVIVYFVVRIIGKYLGSFTGSAIVKKGKSVRNYLGLAMIPQAGVAIGLSELGARSLPDDIGSFFVTIILATSILYELVGPICAKASLYLSKSYSTNLEELTDVSLINEDGSNKSTVEVLIERINAIQSVIPVHDEIEDEAAFTEAAESYMYERRGFLNKRRRNR